MSKDFVGKMALFRFLWLRRLIRNNTKPIPESRAAVWKSRLSIAYALIAWNAFGLVGYMAYTGKADWAQYYGLKSEEELKMSPGHRWAKFLGIENVSVYRVKGFSIQKIEEESSEIASGTSSD